VATRSAVAASVATLVCAAAQRPEVEHRAEGQSQYNQVVALTGGTVKAVEVELYYERIIVSNTAAAPVYVSTDGSIVSTSEGDFGAVVDSGAWRMVGNDQPRQPLVSKTAPGSTVQNTGYEGSTTPNLETLASGYPTYVSLLCADTGNVVLEFV
jgi:hypothetical protein